MKNEDLLLKMKLLIEFKKNNDITLVKNLSIFISSLEFFLSAYPKLPDAHYLLKELDSKVLDLESIYAWSLDYSYSVLPKNYGNAVINTVKDVESLLLLLVKIYNKNLLIRTDIFGKLTFPLRDLHFARIFYDTVSGGYLLSLYKTLPQKDSDLDEWFDSYEELEKYFKDNNLQVEWLED